MMLRFQKIGEKEKLIIKDEVTIYSLFNLKLLNTKGYKLEELISVFQEMIEKLSDVSDKLDKLDNISYKLDEISSKLSGSILCISNITPSDLMKAMESGMDVFFIQKCNVFSSV